MWSVTLTQNVKSCCGEQELKTGTEYWSNVKITRPDKINDQFTRKKNRVWHPE